MPLVEMINVNREYGSGRTLVEALHPTNFTLNRGEFVAIIGPSGSGKTTFLTILGLLQSPTRGQIFVDGKDVTKMNSGRKTDLRFNKLVLSCKHLI
jgi:ABC-type antimicrobial peptide transport system, ATPase component